MRVANLLYNVSDGNENATTELLCNLMSKCYLRSIILENFGVPKPVIKKISFEDIETQSIITEGKKPDICIENDTVKIFIENKVAKNVDLQESQITIYPDEIENAKSIYKCLIFLIPKNYSHEAEIINAKKRYAFIQIVYWQDFIKEMRSIELVDDNPIIRDTLCHFENVLDVTNTSTNYTLREVVLMNNINDLREANNVIIKTKEYLKNVTVSIIEKLGNDYTLSTNSWEQEDYGFGMWILYKGKWLIFIGYAFLIENDEYAFSLSIHESIINNDKAKEYNSYKKDDYFYFKIDKYLITSDRKEEELAKYCIDIINNTIKI